MRRSWMRAPSFLIHSSSCGSSALHTGQWYMKNSITSTFLPAACTACGWLSVMKSTPFWGTAGDATANEVETSRHRAAAARRRERMELLQGLLYLKDNILNGKYCLLLGMGMRWWGRRRHVGQGIAQMLPPVVARAHGQQACLVDR